MLFNFGCILGMTVFEIKIVLLNEDQLSWTSTNGSRKNWKNNTKYI